MINRLLVSSGLAVFLACAFVALVGCGSVPPAAEVKPKRSPEVEACLALDEKKYDLGTVENFHCKMVLLQESDKQHQTACTETYRTTKSKPLGMLTADEAQAVAACQYNGWYNDGKGTR